MKAILFTSLVLLISCNSTKAISTDSKAQKEIYKSWVLSRCLSKAFPDENLKQDALNSASAYLEQSNMPVDAFTDAEPLINEFLQQNYQGSIPGSFNTKKCIDLFNSPKLENFYLKEKNKK